MDGDDALRLRIFFFPDAQVQRASINVGRDVRLALMLGQREAGGVPAFGEHARAVGDGQARVIRQFRAGNAFPKILVNHRRPVAG